MGVDRRKYVISAELAMQREMTYREKLENPKSKQFSSSTVIIPQMNPLPSQVATSASNPSPRPNQNPSPANPVLFQNPRPTQHPRPATPVMFPNPRAYPAVGLRPQQAPPQMCTGTVYSGLNSIEQVQISTLSRTVISNSMPRPTVGLRPEQAPPQRVTATAMIVPNPRPGTYTRPNTAQALPQRFNPQYTGPSSVLSRPSTPTYLAHQKRKTPFQYQAKPKRLELYSPDDFYCKLCQADCSSELNLRMHLKGQKHKSMLRNAQAKKADGGTSEATEKLYCESCGIWCTDMNSLTLHLNGKSHYLKLRIIEKQLSGPDRAS